jgi:signal transduction histidine kinase
MISLSFLLLLAVGLAMSVLGIFTLLNNVRRRTNIYFAFICFSLVAWVVFNYLADADLARSLLWTRLTFFSVDLTAFFGVLFANEFPKISFSTRWFYVPVSLGVILMSIITFLPVFIPAITVINGVSTVKEGPLYLAFVIYYFAYLLGLVGLLTYTFLHVRGSDKSRVEYVLSGILLMSICTSTTNLVLPLVLGNNDLASFGGYFTLIFTGFTSYAIVRHRLFDIRLLVARSVAYVLLIATLAALYGLTVFGVTSILFSDATPSTSLNVVHTALAIVLALTFPPLKRFFERLTDKIFYRNMYDTQALLNRVGQVLVAEFKLERLLRKTLAEICGQLKITQGQFYIFDEGRIYKVEHYGALPHKMITAPHLSTLRHRVLVADELAGGREKAIMDEFGYRFAMHLRTKEEFVGFLLLGDKLSGDIFTGQDIKVLQILGQELAVAISNAKAYEEISHFNATLQGKIDDATKRLRQANAHLKELDAAKDEFISMASHQLRTPLTTIKGYLSMLSEGDAGKMSQGQLEFINYAYGGAQRMVNLISDLLNVSRMSAGKFMIEKTAVDLAHIVSEEVFQLQSHAQAKQLKLSFVQPKKPLPPIQLDENKTRQVIMNFIDNAIYYTKAGSVTVNLEKVGQNVELRVKDTGIGVPPAAQKKLFTKFYRAENAQTVRPDGTGLGLYLAKRVIQDQEGRIIFETEEGKGSTFGFSFPLKTGTGSAKAVENSDLPVDMMATK